MREENIQRLELLADDLISSDGYLMEENAMLRKEVDLLKDQADIKPQLNKFALENMRLLQQIKMYPSLSLSTCFFFFFHWDKWSSIIYTTNILLKSEISVLKTTTNLEKGNFY